MVFSFELFVNLISPHATRSRATHPRCRRIDIASVAAASRAKKGWVFYLRTAAQQTVTLRTEPAAICFTYVLGRSGEAEAGQAKYPALFPRRFHFI
jgi:hypothetical protein